MLDGLYISVYIGACLFAVRGLTWSAAYNQQQLGCLHTYQSLGMHDCCRVMGLLLPSYQVYNL